MIKGLQGYQILYKSVILIEKRTIRANGSLGPRTIMFIFYSPYKYMYLKKTVKQLICINSLFLINDFLLSCKQSKLTQQILIKWESMLQLTFLNLLKLYCSYILIHLYFEM